MTYTIHTSYVHMVDATVRRTMYHDGTTALVADSVDEDGFPDTETLSINLGGYGLAPAAGNVFVKNYSEHAGLPEALQRAGVGVIVRTVAFGPFDATAAEMRLTLSEAD